jgi:hypothetical protein
LADIDTVHQLQVEFKKVEEDHMQEDTEMMENSFEQKKKRLYKNMEKSRYYPSLYSCKKRDYLYPRLQKDVVFLKVLHMN